MTGATAARATSVLVLVGLALAFGIHEAAAELLYDAGIMERLLAPSADPEAAILPALFVLLRLALMILGPGLALAALVTLVASVLRARPERESVGTGPG